MHVTQYYVPGLGYQENCLPREQRRLGEDVWVIAGDQLPPRLNHSGLSALPAGVHEDRGVPIVCLKARWMSQAREQVALVGLAEQVRRLAPDVIHAHGLWTLPTLQLLWANKPACRFFADDHVDDHNLALDRWPTRLRVALFRALVLPRLRRQVAKFLAAQPHSYWHLVNRLGIPEKDVALLPLGIDDETFRPDPDGRAEWRTRLGFRPEHVVFVTAGALDPAKGIGLLIESCARLHHNYPHLRLLIIGQGQAAYLDHLREQVQALALSEAVLFHEWVAQETLSKLYNTADVGVMPRKLGAVKEALAVGLPLVVPQQRSTEYFIAGDNGLSFLPGDATDLAGQLARYLSDDSLRQAHSAHSLELVRTQLSWKKIAETSVEIYRQ